jgi:Glutathione S-transferase, C-terminal domain
MIAGHFGFAAIVKSREPEAPLWALMLATVWLDIVFVPLFLMHIETTETVEGTGFVYGGNIIHANYTHSLVGAVVLSALPGTMSLAINMYLAETYAGAPLWPAGAKDHALVYQWSLWAANEIEPRIVSIAKGLSKKSPGPSAATAGLEHFYAALRILEDRLNGPYLVGDAFTVGDLNVASILREPGEDGVSGISAIDLARFPSVARWLDCCSARPANRRVGSMVN